MRRRWLGVREEFWWMVHNLIAHPIGQVLYMLGWVVPRMQVWGDWLHDATIPKHTRGEGHG